MDCHGLWPRNDGFGRMQSIPKTFATGKAVVAVGLEPHCPARDSAAIVLG